MNKYMTTFMDQETLTKRPLTILFGPLLCCVDSPGCKIYQLIYKVLSPYTTILKYNIENSLDFVELINRY